ncbi:SagB-type dehydrogenase family enzyme [Kribbella sp. VKM Ac-2527]|uniref:SagB-type dehydrogenase family enzyme n=1 Tax=Kribbella caucasensis TaxID=2512215 RepID=A0A4V3C5N1_9ACTN|nr:SagB/ThcOx family dehydrogenase [Kribbella sp. VKM Ac-2527]TDO30218.1 SagB-type dehydrogenase family enzyme [Kribbella sp. VKM Ac-2527]
MTDSSALAQWVMTLPSPIQGATFVANAAERLALTPHDASRLLDVFVRYGLLSPEHRSPTAAEEAWRRLGWGDALTFHRATRGLRWRHVYPEGAEVYTFYHVDKLVVPDEPRPGVEDPEHPQEVILPAPARQFSTTELRDVLQARRTCRNFARTSIDLDELSTILHWSFRRIAVVDSARYYATRVASESGKVGDAYPFLTVHVVFDPVQASAAGLGGRWLYRYSPQRHALVPVGQPESPLKSVSELLWGVDFADGAPAVLILSINWAQYMWKYRTSHFYRMAHYDVGGFAQTALLVATAMGLRSFVTPAIDDDRLVNLLHVTPSEQDPTYLIAVGGPRSRHRAPGPEPAGHEPEELS